MNGGRAKRFWLLVLCGFGVLLFSALGVWQVERRAWKLDLIERVDARVHAPAARVPARSEWPSLNPKEIEYRHVAARGRFLHQRETLVDALTERGPGYWVMTPLQTDEGTILVNRGFVPPDRRDPRTRPAGQLTGVVAVDGLVRLTEPHGRFLRANRPDRDLWYSRDVAAIGQRRSLHDLAPFFIDAGASRNPGGLPIGGLTVISFRNAHLVYALTWFGLAALSLAGLVIVRKSAQ